MKFTQITTAATLLATTVFAAPTEYPAPPGGWESVKYPAGTGENLPSYPAPAGGWESVKYPPGTGANLPSYPAPPGGWESVTYPPGTGEAPKTYTSSFNVVAVGAEVRNGTVSVPGPKEAVGYFYFGINSVDDTICFKITLLNVAGTYQSPARTATHVHAAVRGASGPPRLAFPNPVGDDKRRESSGCLKGPFTTGLLANGVDTGVGFKLSQIEANPAGFFADSHTNLFPLGVVRGQLA
ncbi:hypothetical protein PVAG01_06621 [Phlyctema vagabunda]|uniref:CHRD domain-containing protein n=1 Tax=Phlyctema vagabunda TaxID=108571 RepID=A0ABR4PGQ3_9HELO